MPAGIFLVQNDGLVELSESPYDSEDVLQGLLAQYPRLMAGDQFDAERPRRWLLVKRELGIPDAQGQAGRWSVDHLFLDQDAVPTLRLSELARPEKLSALFHVLDWIVAQTRAG